MILNLIPLFLAARQDQREYKADNEYIILLLFLTMLDLVYIGSRISVYLWGLLALIFVLFWFKGFLGGADVKVLMILSLYGFYVLIPVLALSWIWMYMYKRSEKIPMMVPIFLAYLIVTILLSTL